MTLWHVKIQTNIPRQESHRVLKRSCSDRFRYICIFLQASVSNFLLPTRMANKTKEKRSYHILYLQH